MDMRNRIQSMRAEFTSRRVCALVEQIVNDLNLRGNIVPSRSTQDGADRAFLNLIRQLQRKLGSGGLKPILSSQAVQIVQEKLSWLFGEDFSIRQALRASSFTLENDSREVEPDCLECCAEDEVLARMASLIASQVVQVCMTNPSVLRACLRMSFLGWQLQCRITLLIRIAGILWCLLPFMHMSDLIQPSNRF